MLKLFASGWIFRFGVVSEGGGRQQGYRACTDFCVSRAGYVICW